MEEVKKTFKPEFLNRVDDIIVFKSLTKENLHDIVELEIADVVKRLKNRQIEMELTKDAIELLVEKGFDPVYGARLLKKGRSSVCRRPYGERAPDRPF